MKAIIKKALGETESVRFRLLLEHYTRAQSGIKSNLDEGDANILLEAISHRATTRLTYSLRAIAYGASAVQLSIAAYEVELEKLIGGCRLLRAIIELQKLLDLDVITNEYVRAQKKLLEAGFDMPTWEAGKVNIDEHPVDNNAIFPAISTIQKGKLKIDTKPLSKEVRDQYKNTIGPRAEAIGSLKGFEKFIREERILTDAVKRDLDHYGRMMDDASKRFEQHAELVAIRTNYQSGAKSESEIEEENLNFLFSQCKAFIEGRA